MKTQMCLNRFFADWSFVSAFLILLTACSATAGEIPQTVDNVEKLLHERLGMLVEIAKLQLQAYQQGESNFEAVLSAQTDVLSARLELAKTVEERIMIRKNLLETARQLEEVTTRLVQAREASQIDVLRAKALRLRAEADLLRERGGKS